MASPLSLRFRPTRFIGGKMRERGVVVLRSTRDERPSRCGPMAPGEASVAEAGPMLHKAFDLLLEPESCPAAGVIRIDENLFAVGRFEAPFASYETDAVAQLSRRH